MNNIVPMRVGIREYVSYAMDELYTRMPIMSEWQDQMAREQFTEDYLKMSQNERDESFKDLVQALVGHQLR